MHWCSDEKWLSGTLVTACFWWCAKILIGKKFLINANAPRFIVLQLLRAFFDDVTYFDELQEMMIYLRTIYLNKTGVKTLPTCISNVAYSRRWMRRVSFASVCMKRNASIFLCYWTYKLGRQCQNYILTF